MKLSEILYIIFKLLKLSYIDFDSEISEKFLLVTKVLVYYWRNIFLKLAF